MTVSHVSWAQPYTGIADESSLHESRHGSFFDMF